MEGKRGLPNTANTSPERLLADAFLMGPSEAIQHQEAQGQQDFVASDTLPTRVDGKEGDDATALLSRIGIKVLGPVDGDDLFQFVEIPEGWKKEPTDHSMWSKLVDEKGRERAAIFYKAAHYDRVAEVKLSLPPGLLRVNRIQSSRKRSNRRLATVAVQPSLR